MPLVAILSVVTGLLAATWFGPSLAAVASLVSVHERSQASAILVVTISVVGSLLGPVVAGAASQMLTPIFGGEALRYGLLAVSPIILLASLFFWRASQHYRADLAR
jgi:MFS family permease